MPPAELLKKDLIFILVDIKASVQKKCLDGNRNQKLKSDIDENCHPIEGRGY